MATVRWDPWGELAMLQRDVNNLLGRTTRRAETYIPPMDVFRTSEGLTVRLELAGMRPGDVDVSVNDGLLTISGERKLDGNVADDAWIHRERFVGRFERSLSLPEGTDPSAISARFEDGVLELAVPAPPERRPHKVEIAVGGGEGQTVDVNEQQ
ncbi:MAG TPA: Hsp20/alpha crystallin family protein [Egibacteraceae bacterium]|nr:Hsp20/alpha crystallin family protein [Egibacteraceae bacterium]